MGEWRESRVGFGFRIALFSALALACLLPATTLAVGTPVFESCFGPDGTCNTNFANPGAVAVDEGSHVVYVADLSLGTLSKFDQNGTPTNFSALGENGISGFSFSSSAEGLNEIAVNSTSHDFYVADIGAGSIKAFEGDGEEAEFTEGPGAGSNQIPAFSEVCGVAVDSNGDIYMGDYGTGVHVFEPSGKEVTSFATSEPCNVAVDSSGDVYVSHYFFFAPGIEKFTPSEFPVAATTTYPSSGVTVDANATFALAVDPVSHELFADEHELIAQYVGASREGTFGALTASEGVAVDGATGKVYVTDTEGERQVEVFAPPPAVPPSVGAISFSNVTAIAADVQAQVNPESFDTHYRFQYVTQASFEASGFTSATETTEADLGSGATPQSASAHLDGLVPDTAYRFRIIAENENGDTISPEPAPGFTTFAVPPPGLPDGRAYEMVSPPQKLGEVFPPEPSRRLGSSCPFECLPGINAQLMPMQSDPSGEAVVYEGQPFSDGLASAPNEYLSSRSQGGWGTRSLSPLHAAESERQGYTAFSPDLSRGVIYQIEPAFSPEAPTLGGESYANLYLRGADGSLRPLVSEAPPARDPGRLSLNAFEMTFAGANAGTALAPAFSHLIFEANDALSEEVPGIAPPAPAITASEKNLYEWVGGQLRLVNVLPGNAVAASGAVIGSGRLLAKFPGLEGPEVDHAISADGSRIFWSEASGQVYVRIGGAETQKIEDPGKFLTASADGTEVLLNDGCLYDLETKTCKDLTLDQLSVHRGGFEGILGGAEDLSHIYFVDTAVLTGGEENANEEHAEAGEFNLYGWQEGDTTFIGTLLGVDNEIGGNVYGDWRPRAAGRTAQVSSDGRYLAFMSTASLTGYDNKRKSGSCDVGPLCNEVFEYDVGARKLICASCNPSGDQPLEESNLSLINGAGGFPPLAQPGNLSTDGEGRLFFESQDVLSPHDSNGQIQDVYEWEPNGVGNCERVGGCVFLISSGQSANDSMFLNSTPSGDDAFFITREQLLPADKDQRLDVYVGRVGGGFEEAGTAPCGVEACKGPITTPPVLPSAGSAEFSGPPNPKPHKPKKHHHKHKKKHKRHHKRSAKRNRGGAQ